MTAAPITTTTEQQPTPNPTQQQQQQQQLQQEHISNKIITRFNNLTPSTSKESIQTSTKWILYHAIKHPIAIHQTLKQMFIIDHHDHHNNNTKMTKWSSMLTVYWNILHEICYCYSSSAIGTNGIDEQKWNKYNDFRSGLAEIVILPFLECLLYMLQLDNDNHTTNNTNNDDNGDVALVRVQNLQAIQDVRGKLDHMITVWTEVDSFQSPTLLDDIKRIIVKISQVDIASIIERITTTIGSNNDENESTMMLKDDLLVNNKDNNHTDNDDNIGISHEGDNTINESTNDDNKTKNVIVSDSTPFQSTTTIPIEDTDDHRKINSSSNTPTPSIDEDDEMEMFGTTDSIDNDEHNNDNSTDGEDAKNEFESEMDVDKNDNTAALTKDQPFSDKDIKNTTTEGSSKGKKRRFDESNTEIDFEKEGVPIGNVEVNELLEPCKAIGTMQITRDLRNDFSHSLSSALSLVPEDVYIACEKAIENGDNSGETIDLTGLVVPDDILDYNINDAISNIRMHREIIQKQKECRQTVIELLLKSRCEFGSKDDAELFYTLDEISTTLQQRLGQVKDAMELEGLDFEGLDDANSKNNESEDTTPTGFSWLPKEEAQSRVGKKQRSG